MAPTGSSHASFAAGGIVIIAGLYAYIRKGSLASLVGSAILGGTILIGGLLIQRKENFLGHAVSCAGSAGLVVLGIVRFRATGKSMPALPLILIGGASSAYQFMKAKEWQ